MRTRRVVIDTNVLVSALLSPEGNPAKIYRIALASALSWVLSADRIYRDA